LEWGSVAFVAARPTICWVKGMLLRAEGIYTNIDLDIDLDMNVNIDCMYRLNR